MKPGSRVVSHVFPIPGVKPDQVLKVTSAEDDVERPVYLYTLPLTKEKPGERSPTGPGGGRRAPAVAQGGRAKASRR